MPVVRLIRVVQQLARVALQNVRKPKLAAAVARAAVRRVAGTALPRRLPPGFISRQVWRSVGRGGGPLRNLRSAAIGLWHHSHDLTGRHGRWANNRFELSRLLRTTQAPSYELIDRVRELFGENVRLREATKLTQYPNSLNGYEIGAFIAKGSNGVVYEAAVRQNDTRNTTVTRTDGATPMHTSLVRQANHQVQIFSDQKQCPLALKMIFNYDFDASEAVLFDTFQQELVPVPESVLRGNFGSVFRRGQRLRGLSGAVAHPNVVRVHTAFIDAIPSLLPDSIELFPEAIPPPDLDLFSVHPLPPQTLFLVMKRYRMTLYEYLRQFKPTSRAAHVMSAQLFEGVRYLVEQTIAHRDLKSDNLLLEFNSVEDIPHLAIADFGTSHSSLRLPYFIEDTDLGGNLCLRAPEIKTAKPARGRYLDLSKADLWAAGTLVYEIYTGVNPFYNYRQLDSQTYTKADLPTLPIHAPRVLSKLISDVLKRNPLERPACSVVSAVLALSLWRLGDFARLLIELASDVDAAVSLFFAETVMASRLAAQPLSDAELTLRCRNTDRHAQLDQLPQCSSATSSGKTNTRTSLLLYFCSQALIKQSWLTSHTVNVT